LDRDNYYDPPPSLVPASLSLAFTLKNAVKYLENWLQTDF
jgi:hypothetical protein